MSCKTEKLYYTDAYISSFTARVIEIKSIENGFDVVLDKTAFFPEEGGQSSDRGTIGEANVSHVYERDSVVHHVTDRSPDMGVVECKIEFSERFEKMQCHTAEHILCGIIHRLFGFDNVGFHLGDDEVTFDVNGVLDRSQLDTVENMANEIIFSNVEIETSFPTSEELLKIDYRAKLDLTDGVRLVKIGDVDTCACCAPHVSRSGEIGIIKILDFMKHRGGTRIWMVAGRRAVLDYRSRYDSVKKISGLLSTPQSDVADTLYNYISESEGIKASLKIARTRIAELSAESVKETDGSKVFLFPDFSIPELIAFSNIANKKISGITVSLSGSEGDYKYVISSATVDLREMSREINSALGGRGGGRPEMIQGSFSADLQKIIDYFEK